MSVSRPRKKKFIKILIILSNRTDGDIDNEIDDGLNEQALNLMAAVQPQMNIDEHEWSDEQNAVWSAVEAMDVLDPQNFGTYNMEDLVSNFATAVGELEE